MSAMAPFSVQIPTPVPVALGGTGATTLAGAGIALLATANVFTQNQEISKATPALTLTATTTTINTLNFSGATDNGSNPIGLANARIGASTTATVRPLWGVANNGTVMANFAPIASGAASFLSWLQNGSGIGAPTFTTRSAGTKLVFYEAVGGSSVDWAFGSEATGTWFSVADTSRAKHWYWYGGTTRVLDLNGSGETTQTQVASTSGAAGLATWVGGAHTGLTAGTESIDINFNLARTVQFTGGSTITNQRAFVAQAPTYGMTSSTTITNAATVAITGAPVAGTNTTITNTHALWIQAGNTQLDGGATFGLRVNLKSYTVATLPAAGVAGGLVYVSDAAVAPCVAFSNGTNWKRCDNAATTVI